MKRFLLMLSLILFCKVHSQLNTITIDNHSLHYIYFKLVANDRTNWPVDCVSICESTKFGVLEPVSRAKYDLVNNAFLNHPPLPQWRGLDLTASNWYDIDLSIGQTTSSEIKTTTRWNRIIFYTEDPNTNPNATEYSLGPWCATEPLPTPNNFFATPAGAPIFAEWLYDNTNVRVVIHY